MSSYISKNKLQIIMKNKIGILILVTVILALFIYFYAYKNHRDISSEKSDYTLTVEKLQSEFTTNDSLANSKFQDKTIEISGLITQIDIESKGIVIDDKLSGTFKDKLPSDLVKGVQIKVKGRFIGYDELLEEFKIDQISVIK